MDEINKQLQKLAIVSGVSFKVCNDLYSQQICEHDEKLSGTKKQQYDLNNLLSKQLKKRRKM